MTGYVIDKVVVRRDGLRWQFPDNMADRLAGQQVLRLRRQSKYLLVDLGSGETLIIHLGMSGRMTIHRSSADMPDPVKHDHVSIYMNNEARIDFNDARRFGSMDLCVTDCLDDHRLLAGLGPEPLGNAFDEDYLSSRLKGRKMPIKSALLDQKIVAGLGNIYVCEALWRAGISPLRISESLSKKRVASLVPVIRAVLNEAIESGGSSLKDFRKTDGELGYFQHKFSVYDRENQPCRTPDCKGKIARVVQSGRSSFYCARCQR